MAQMESTVQVGETLHSSSSAYTVLEFIGEGSFGKVAKCLNVNTQDTVAIKILTKDSTEAEDAEREIAMLELISVRDPDQINVVKFLEKFEHAGQTCLVFEMLYTDFYEIIRECGPMPLTSIRPVAQQLLVALDSLKGLGILHTDIKPDNVMLVSQDLPIRVKLIDFGLATPVSSIELGELCQPIGCRAPEVSLGLPYNEAIDMWGLGCLLGFFYLADNPFPDTDYQVMKVLIEVLGQPEDYLLNAGVYTRNFFTKKDEETDGPTWRLLTPEEYETLTGEQLQEKENQMKLPSSLDGLAHIYPVDKPAELEDTLAFVDLLKGLMHLDGALRISPSQALQHPFITMSHLSECPDSSDYLKTAREMMGAPTNPDQESAAGAKEDVRAPCTCDGEMESTVQVGEQGNSSNNVPETQSCNGAQAENSTREMKSTVQVGEQEGSYNNVPETQSCNGAQAENSTREMKSTVQLGEQKDTYNNVPETQSCNGAQAENSTRERKSTVQVGEQEGSYNNVPETQSCNGAQAENSTREMKSTVQVGEQEDSYNNVPETQSCNGAQAENSTREMKSTVQVGEQKDSYNNVPETQSCNGAQAENSTREMKSTVQVGEQKDTYNNVPETQSCNGARAEDSPREMESTVQVGEQEDSYNNVPETQSCNGAQAEDSPREMESSVQVGEQEDSYANVPETQSCHGAQAEDSPREMESTVQVGETLHSSLSAYTILEFIGEGYFGKVAKCLNVNTQDTVAIKILKKDSTEAEDAEREIAMLDLISVRDPDHINVVKFLEKFEHAGQNCLVFEMLYKDLFEMVCQCGPMPLNKIRPVAQQLLVALDALKGLGILHTDIKPDNVMMASQDLPIRVKLIDFGEATPVSSIELGELCQPIGCRAPEVSLGLPYNEAIDMWGLGCLLGFFYLADNPFPNTDYEMMKALIEVLGQPEDYMLNAGVYTRNFFTKKDEETDGSTWRLLTPEEYETLTGEQLQEDENQMKLPSSLDGLAHIYPVDKPAEFEDRLAFVDLLKGLMHLDGALRISPSQALQHPFITMSHLSEHPDSSDYLTTARKMMGAPQNPDQESAAGAKEDVRAPCTCDGEMESTVQVGEQGNSYNNVPEEEGDPFTVGADQAESAPPPSTSSSRFNRAMKRIRRFFKRVKTTFCCCCPVEDD
ncbi:probable serine/threonine-protein kinase dyrk1 [Notolabrus celidotus]|uniref:probable serine/threonine-protein kinase dyrk1 n=1 Tax=Notolabrus celidotus TaxID=1203425 RepID=UPI00148F890F|nr:probable serine/threonine-protein kinase dyrk1 [Notolabrus celidotus]